MNAFDLITDIFARPQADTEANVRRLTPAQLTYLRDLIEAEGPTEAIEYRRNGLVWSPAGRHKYILAEDLSARRRAVHTVTRLSNLTPTGAGRLF